MLSIFTPKLDCEGVNFFFQFVHIYVGLDVGQVLILRPVLTFLSRTTCLRVMSRTNKPTLSPYGWVTVVDDGVIEGFTTEQFTVITTEKFTTADSGKRVDP